ncbi:MAG: M28 family peptidase [Cyanobacteria bacterium P01_A01_bin.116]
MSKSYGLFLTVAALVMSIVIWGNPVSKLVAAFSPTATPSGLEALSPATTELNVAQLNLTVDESQLMAHVTALAQPRFTLEDKVVARQYITEQLMRYGFNPQEQRYDNSDNGAPDGVNIVATLAGTDPAAGAIVLGAHYDTMMDSPGADDNGSAIATLLEAARIFSTAANTLENATPANEAPLNISRSFPARSLQLVFFDQEEHQTEAGKGLLGSVAFTKSTATAHNIKGAVILDMIGYACRTPGCQSYPGGLPLPDVPDTGDFLAILGLKSHTELLGAFMRSAQENWPLALTLPIPKPTLKLFPDLLRSDHAPFWERNIPAVFVTDTANFRNPNYHTPQDTPDTLDRSFFRGSAQHVINAIATLLG